MPTLTNPHEALNRQRKADRIADALWAHAVANEPDEASLATTVEMVASSDEGWRRAFARALQEDAPSPETWEQVAARLRELMALRQTVHRTFEAAHA